MPSHNITNISKQTFNAVLARYASAAPEKLRDLDTLRYDDIPAAVEGRKDGKGLENKEVERLVEWKLYV